VEYFKNAVLTDDQHLSGASDSVPMDGLVTSGHYFDYVEHFRKAFLQGGDGIAVATHLLCRKRPDMFVIAMSWKLAPERRASNS
jgi:hypothetical protein